MSNKINHEWGGLHLGLLLTVFTVAVLLVTSQPLGAQPAGTGGAGAGSAGGDLEAEDISPGIIAKKFDLLLEALKSGLVSERKEAARLLASTGDPRVVEPLFAALKDGSGEVRIQAARGLSNYKGMGLGERFIELFKEDDAGIRMAAANGLLWLGEEDTIPLLVDGVTSESVNARHSSIMTLSAISDPRSFVAIKGAAEGDEDPFIRTSALLAISRMADVRAFDVVLGALKDSDDGVRARAATRLGEMGDKRAVGPLIEALRHSVDTEGLIPVYVVIALYKLTGLEFTSVGEWEEWYKENK